MSKQEVKIYMDDDRNIFARKQDGTEYEIRVFEGGGYYTALWPQTAEEIADGVKKREEADKKWMAEITAKNEERKVNGIAKLIMLIQRSHKS